MTATPESFAASAHPAAGGSTSSGTASGSAVSRSTAPTTAATTHDRRLSPPSDTSEIEGASPLHTSSATVRSASIDQEDPSLSSGNKHAAPGGDAGLDGSQPLKKKRKQLVACDSCRLRRVKCDRSEKAIGEDCSECLKKSIKCTDNYVRQKPKVVRSGKLITQAKVLFGPNDAPLPNEPYEVRQNAHSDSLPLGVVDQLNIQATNDSRLAKIAVERELSQHLIELYEHVIHAQLPVLDYDNFIKVWRSLDCDTSALPPALEFLSAVMQAWSARFSDHPAIIGHASPLLPDVTKNFGQDYSTYGNKRAAFCRAMTERALRVADTTGAMRHPTNATAGALLMLELLMSFSTKERRQGRHLITSAIEHLRQIHEGHSEIPGEIPSTLEKSSGSALFWFAYSRDAVTSLFAQRANVLSSDDLAVLCEILRAPITADPGAFVTSPDPQLLQGLAVVSSFRHLTSVVRSCCANVTNPIARKYGSVNSASVLSIWSDAEKSALYSHQLIASIRKADWSNEGVPQSHVWFRDLTGVRYQLLCSLHSFLIETLTAAEMSKEPAPELPNLRHLKQASDRHFLVACRDLAHMLHGYRGAALVESYLVTEFIEECLMHMISMPASRSGEAFYWTIEEKMTDIHMLVSVMKIVGWASPALGPAIEAGESCLASLAAGQSYTGQGAREASTSSSAAGPSRQVNKYGGAPQSAPRAGASY